MREVVHSQLVLHEYVVQDQLLSHNLVMLAQLMLHDLCYDEMFIVLKVLDVCM